MYLGANKIPQQRLPLSQKTKKWREECVEAYIEPYGKKRENFPSTLKNYPIIKPIIDLLIGEKSKRPLNFSVTVANGDAVSKKEEEKKKKLMTAMLEVFSTELEGKEGEQGLPKKVMEQFEMSYVDRRAIQGQNAVNYIMQNEEIYDKFQKAFFHYVVSGECYSHKGVRRNEPFYDVINPLDVDYDKDPDLEFVEDGDWSIVRRFAHASTVIDHYGEYLSDAEVLELENPQHSSVDTYLLYRSEASGGDANVARNRTIETITVYWKSRKRIGFLTYQDPVTGMEEEMEVVESYRMPAELKAAGAKLKYEFT